MDKKAGADGVSEKTPKWLKGYNSLSEEEKTAISHIPFAFYEEGSLAETRDSGAAE